MGFLIAGVIVVVCFVVFLVVWAMCAMSGHLDQQDEDAGIARRS